jgi:hypothetical protein
VSLQHTVAEKSELDIRMILGSIGVPAIHDPRFAWMQFELTGLEPFSDAIKHIFRLPLTLAMEHRIVSVPGKPDARQMPRHPHIKRKVQEEIRQDRRNYALNTKDNFQFERKICGWRQGHWLLDLRRK